MNKMIAFFVAIISMIAFMRFNPDAISMDGCEKVVVVTENQYENLDENPIKNGADFYHVLTGEKIKYFADNMSNISYKGLSLYYNKDFKLGDLEKMFSAQINSGSGVDGYEIYYGYCPKYKDCRQINGKKINLQLVKTDDGWIAGFPLILTGF